jgi:hydroxymethylbilane synthase
MWPDRGHLRVGTRSSRLALWQTDAVIARLEAVWPGLAVERVPISTLGDRVTEVALSRIGDKGLFTRELEEGLRTGAIDLAVHSLKDLPTDPQAGLALGAVLEREDPRDVLVARGGLGLASLSPGARLGTSSLRRRAQLAALRPDLEIVDIRGNVPTRIDKVLRGDVEASVLAYAGLLRLGLEAHVADVFDADRMVPAPGQGAMAVQIREDDSRLERLVAPLDHLATRLATTAERALLGYLEGGCQVPVGALTTTGADGTLKLTGIVASLDGRRLVRREASARVASVEDAAALGEALARDMLDQGAREILAAIRLAPLGPSRGEDPS